MGSDLSIPIRVSLTTLAEKLEPQSFLHLVMSKKVCGPNVLGRLPGALKGEHG